MLLRPFLRRLARVGVAHVRCRERKPILQKRLRDLAQSDLSFQAKASLHLMSSRWFNQVHSELLAHQKLALCPLLAKGGTLQLLLQTSSDNASQSRLCAWFLFCVTAHYQCFTQSPEPWSKFGLLKSLSTLKPCSADRTACATREHSRRHRKSRARSQGISVAPEARNPLTATASDIIPVVLVAVNISLCLRPTHLCVCVCRYIYIC